MNSYKKYSEMLTHCVYTMIQPIIKVEDIDKLSLEKSLINRLYYALYNRIMSELPNLQSSTTPNKHMQINDILLKQSSNRSIQQVQEVFQDMKVLREWADYKPNETGPPYNLNTLQYKVYSIVKRKKIF